MSKIIVSQAKFDEAERLYGYEAVRSILVVENDCSHDWHLTTYTSSFTGAAAAFLRCEDCGETKDHLKLID